MTTYILIRAVNWLLQILTFAIIGRALLSWFSPNMDNPIAHILFEVTEPILAPLRRIIPLIGMLDITPIVAIFLIQILDQWLVQALSS